MPDPLRLCPQGCLLLETHRFCAWHGSPLKPLNGTRLGRFEIVGAEDAGGSFRSVYRARHELQKSLEVTVDILRPPFCYHPEIVENFLRVAAALQRLRCPQVPEVIESGRRPWPHVVSHLPPGRTLDSELNALRDANGGRGQGLHLKTGRLLLEGLARGLAASHRQGLVHRNLKPANVLIAELEDENDERNRVRLLDWIIAQERAGSTSAEDAPRSSDPLANVGTPEFMAPEQFRGRFDARTDIYQFGLVAFEVLSGESPFVSGASSGALAQWQNIHENQRPRRLRPLRPEIPRRLCRLVERCLRKLPERRYQSGEELLQAFESLDLSWKERLMRRFAARR